MMKSQTNFKTINTTCVTSETGTAYTSGAPEFIPGS